MQTTAGMARPASWLPDNVDLPGFRENAPAPFARARPGTHPPARHRFAVVEREDNNSRRHVPTNACATGLAKEVIINIAVAAYSTQKGTV